MKKEVYVSVIGASGTGKTAVVLALSKALKEANVETDVDWGIDGEPRTAPEFEARRLAGVSAKTKVFIAERPVRRKERPATESFKDLGIIVCQDQVKGYGIQVMVLGVPIEAWFGDLERGKSRARMLGERLSAELDVEMIDLIPRDHEWSQPKY